LFLSCRTPTRPACRSGPARRGRISGTGGAAISAIIVTIDDALALEAAAVSLEFGLAM
jgi:hypothetical protein